MYYTIYKIINLVNEKYYLGMHKTKDLNDNYMGSGKILKHAIEKYGLENFKKEILFIFDNPEDMYAKERELINEDVVKDPNSYNLTVGGWGGNRITDPNNPTRQRSHFVMMGNASKKARQNNKDKLDSFKATVSDNMKQAHLNGKIKYDTFTGKSIQKKLKRKYDLLIKTDSMVRQILALERCG